MKSNYFFLLILASSLSLQAWPPALRNCGNTCFLNSSIQVLYHIPPLSRLLITHDDPYNQNAPAASLYANLAKDFYATQNPNQPITFTCDSTQELLKFTQQAHGLIGTLCGTQQDATEFLWTFLDNLIQKPKSKQLSFNIKLLFSFAVNSEIICPATPEWAVFKSTAQDPYTHLTLNVSDEKNNKHATLQECLQDFFSPQTLDEYTPATQGKKRTDCTRTLSLESTPDVLLIGLKRFEKKYTMQGQLLSSKKLDHTITIPLEELNLNEFVTQKKQNNNHSFQLIGAIIQSGTLEGGHYWAYVQDLTGQWYKCDDASITKVSASGDSMLKDIEGSPNGPTGYLFVYQKKSSRKQSITEYEQMKKDREKKEQEQKALDNLVNNLNKLTQSLMALEKSLKNK